MTRIKSWPSPSYHPLEHPHGHMQQGLMLLHKWNGPATRSASLTLSFSLCVKGLTWRSYIWNDKDYKLALALLNFQVGTNPPTTTLHVSYGLTSQLYRLLIGWAITPFQWLKNYCASTESSGGSTGEIQ
jgi:hypothetical protein